ncbi:hypothetical protein QF001_001653 [Paraburkholderia youngii]
MEDCQTGMRALCSGLVVQFIIPAHWANRTARYTRWPACTSSRTAPFTPREGTRPPAQSLSSPGHEALARCTARQVGPFRAGRCQWRRSHHSQGEPHFPACECQVPSLDVFRAGSEPAPSEAQRRVSICRSPDQSILEPYLTYSIPQIHNRGCVTTQRARKPRELVRICKTLERWPGSRLRHPGRTSVLIAYAGRH